VCVYVLQLLQRVCVCVAAWVRVAVCVCLSVCRALQYVAVCCRVYEAVSCCSVLQCVGGGVVRPQGDGLVSQHLHCVDVDGDVYVLV